MLSTLRSLLVDEETDEYVTLRAAADGTIRGAIALWLRLQRHEWLPYRWSAYDFDDFPDDFPDRPSQTGWTWRGHRFWVRDAKTSA